MRGDGLALLEAAARRVRREVELFQRGLRARRVRLQYCLGRGVEPVLETAAQKILATDPTRAKAALKKLDFAAHAARCGLQKGQPAAAQAALKTIEARATGLHRTVTAMADERDHYKFVAEQLEVKLLGNMRSKQSQIEALTMRVKHDRDALLSTLNEQVVTIAKDIKNPCRRL